MSTTLHPDTDIDVGEAILPQQKKRLLQLVLQRLRFHLVQGPAVNPDEAFASFAVGYSGGRFLGRKQQQADVTEVAFQFLTMLFTLTFLPNTCTDCSGSLASVMLLRLSEDLQRRRKLDEFRPSQNFTRLLE